jgi:hypothetical protein
MSMTGFELEAQCRGVLVPFHAEAQHAYADALGESMPEAVSHFTRFSRFDLSLSEIFHMDYLPAVLHLGGATSLRGDLIPLVVPITPNDEPLVRAAAHTTEDCLRLMKLFGIDPDGYRYVFAGLKMTT